MWTNEIGHVPSFVLAFVQMRHGKRLPLAYWRFGMAKRIRRRIGYLQRMAACDETLRGYVSFNDADYDARRVML